MSIPVISGSPATPLWVVTSYFNPENYQRRRKNFDIFRAHLNAPLLVVELDRHGEFQLGAGDADILVQKQATDQLWQKERCLNLAAQHLPKEAKYMAWVDCDILFENDHWQTETLNLLENGHSLVQLYGGVRYPQKMPLDHAITLKDCQAAPSSLERLSIIKAIKDDRQDLLSWDTANLTQTKQARASNGFAWACAVDRIRTLGLYDANILGSGDNIFLMGLRPELGETFSIDGITPAHHTHIQSWISRARQSGLFDHVAYCEGEIYHLWHGDLSRRSYRERHSILKRHGYCPKSDIRLDQEGLWAWHQPQSALAQEVASYFASRQEDQ